jgi:hypothetical protein
LGGRLHTTKKSTEALVVASKQTGLEVNADKTKYTVMSQEQNARQSHKRLIIFLLYLRERHHLGDPGIDERIILKWIFRQWKVEVWTGSSWLRIGTGGRHL